ncbi:MAG TPA: UDP-N-acetylmuramoyl-L-alanyl-D-glutamate--2,6-diaminopimelate ligase [Bacteroidaceae bacterium]|nr:UDP-N-acetylmuramoyl-L-alanyl-D-glutamate--2,6-diaminopimelate ligase [Bacteroidaceae bacterium]
MQLTELIQQIPFNGTLELPSVNITAITTDSRAVKPGSLFIAVIGTKVDGHHFINQAAENGAAAIICQEIPIDYLGTCPCIVVPDSRSAVGRIATTFYGNPTEKLELVGVTGTNGKTTIATLLYKLFRYFGYKVGLISTVCNYIDDEAIPTEQTTPDPITLNALLGRMADEGCKYAFMEVSSHAVDQNRISGLRFAGGIFTNLTRDHMDYHGNFDNYLAAKKRFFDELPKEAFALTNLDDRNGEVMLQNTKAKTAKYSLRTLCDFKGKVLETHFEGMDLEMNGREVATQFIGHFNASNLLAVYGTACLLGKQPDDILIGISTLHSVAGRFEALRSPSGYTAIIDYAHTPDALINVLKAVQDINVGQGKVITVVGAGGNRDKGKRPIMAQAAVNNSDRVIITSDNPRFEEPQDIVNDMLAGLNKTDMERTLSIVDRREAIRTACALAQPNDIIMIAGKGHENYQDIKGVKHHFDDKEIVQEIFSSQH